MTLVLPLTSLARALTALILCAGALACTTHIGDSESGDLSVTFALTETAASDVAVGGAVYLLHNATVVYQQEIVLTGTGGSTTFTSVAKGTYEVLVQLYSADGTIVLEGRAEVDIASPDTALALVVVSPGSSPPPEPTPAPSPSDVTDGIYSVDPIADAFVRGGIDANTNFGSNSSLIVKNAYSETWDRISFLKFDIRSFTGASLSEAKLLVNVTSLSGALTVSVSSADSNWTEDSITWNTAPSLSAVKGTQKISATGFVEIDVTDYLMASSAEGVVTLALHDAGEANAMVQMGSREAALSVRPSLRITVGDPPSAPTMPTSPTEPGPQPMSDFVRPFGPNAPWNVPTSGLPIHPQSGEYARLLWEEAPDRPGNFNLGFNGYSFPVFDAREATGEYPVVDVNNWGNLGGKKVPWNPKWVPSEGSDAQIIVLDPDTGREWDYWQVAFVNNAVQISNGNLIPGNYFTKEDGFAPSRGVGIQYLAMLVRPEEIAQGAIDHAMAMGIRNTSGDFYVAPATKLEHPGRGPGIPEGMRFAIRVTDAEIEAYVASLPSSLSPGMKNAARTIARAARDYGWFITDTAGAAGLPFEDYASAKADWEALGLGVQTAGGKEYPRDLLDGLLTQERIYTIVPSDAY